MGLVTNVVGTGTTNAVDTTGANLLVVGIATHDDGLTDSKSNSWTGLTLVHGDVVGFTNIVRLYYCFNATVGAGHTFSTTNAYGGIAMQAWSAIATSPFDQENGFGVYNDPTQTSMQPGSVTPAENNEIVISCLMLGATNTTNMAVNSGFTISDFLDAVSGVTYGIGLAYKVQTSGGAENPTWSWTTGAAAATVIATFKTATAASVSSSYYRRRRFLEGA